MSWFGFSRKPQTPDAPKMCVKIETDQDRDERLRNMTVEEMQWYFDRNEPFIVLRQPCIPEDE